MPLTKNSPRDMALVFWTASPKRAADFASAEQEKACWEISGDRAEFWNEVLDAILAFSHVAACPAAATDASAAAREKTASLGANSRQREAPSGRYRQSEPVLSGPALQDRCQRHHQGSKAEGGQGRPHAADPERGVMLPP